MAFIGNPKDQAVKEDPESKRKRALERKRKRATAEKNWDRAMEDEGKKLPSSPLKNKKAKDELFKTIGKAVKNWAGKKGGGKVYASQNKKYGGGVYPRKTVGSDD